MDDSTMDMITIPGKKNNEKERHNFKG